MSQQFYTSEYRNGAEIRHYGSRSAYIKAKNMFEKLNGSGLSPELLDTIDGDITLRHIEGLNFYDYYMERMEDPAPQVRCFEMLCRWYKSYRAVTKVSLGICDLNDFVINEDGLYCMNFENSRPGLPEDDIARFAAFFAMYPAGYSPLGIESAKLFIIVASQILDWNPEQLFRAVSVQSEALAKALGIEEKHSTTRFLSTYYSCAGVVLAGGKSVRMHTDKKELMVDGRTMLEASAEHVALMPQRIISAAYGSKLNFRGFEVVYDETAEQGPMEGILRALKKSKQLWTLFLTCDMPNIPPRLIRLLLSLPKDDVDAVMFRVGGDKKTFPLLIRTKAGALALSDCVKKGELSVTAAITGHMRYKTVNAADIKNFDPKMLWNINTPEEYEAVRGEN